MTSTKHVDIRVENIRDFAIREIVKTLYVESRIMMADPLADMLPAPRLVELQLFILVVLRGLS